MPPVTLNTAAKRALKEQGRELRWLAGKLGVSQSHLSRQLSGERLIGVQQAQRLADLTGIPVSIFLEAYRPPQSDNGEVHA